MIKLDSQKLAFFRQSGWMVITTTASGVFMFMVHPVAVKMLDTGSYGAVTTLLGALNLMLIPSACLQMIFTQQTAAATTPQAQGQLAYTAWRTMLGTLVLWCFMAFFAWWYRAELLSTFKLSPQSLLMTMLAALPMLWVPIVQGLLQGTQDFFWLGWVTLCSGVGRFLCVLVFLLLLHFKVAGVIGAAFLGFFSAFLLGFLRTRTVWTQPKIPIDLKLWLARVVPLTIGLGAAQVMFACDIFLVRKYFSEESSGLYGGVGTIARGLVTFTGPLAAVMFPKIVRSAARGEKSNVFAQTLIVTAGLGCAAALFCTIFPNFFFQILRKKEFFVIAPLVPWFTWCMTPLTVANVLVGNLMARSKFAAVPWLALTTVAYWYTLELVVLNNQGENVMTALERVVQTIGFFNLLFLGVTLAFTWLASRQDGYAQATDNKSS